MEERGSEGREECQQERGKRRKRDKKHFRRREPVVGIGGKAKEIHKENRGREHMERARRLLRKGKAARRTGDFLCKFLTTYFPTNTINITVVVNITVKVSGVCAI